MKEKDSFFLIEQLSVSHRSSAIATNVCALKNERGIGLLELAILIPVLALLVAGLIDYGQFIREMNTLSLVARDAARTAASHARVARNSTPGEVEVLCNGTSTTPDSVNCNASPAQLAIREFDAADATNTPDAIDVAAKKAACLGLRSANLNPADFDVSSEIAVERENPADSTSYGAQRIRLLVQLKPTVKNCLLCWGNLIIGARLRGESVFVLEDTCR